MEDPAVFCPTSFHAVAPPPPLQQLPQTDEPYNSNSPPHPPQTLEARLQPPTSDPHDSMNPPPPETLRRPSNLQPHESQALVGDGGDADGQATGRELAEKPLSSGASLLNTHSGADDCSGGEEEASSGRRRRTRWDADSSEQGCGDGTGSGRKRKSRWADDAPPPVIQLPDFMKDFSADLDPEVQALNFRLLEINRKLQSGLPLDDRPEGARSPSPEPIYDNMGVRINTREYRARGKLMNERQEVISILIQKNPAFRPPADYRPPKLQKKLYIPKQDYPGYNFIGLIIGPRGNTQKRMEKETGAKIVIRGKGSVKEGRMQQKRNMRYDPGEDEDLHVLVEAETQDALDKAADMVEKLLQPVDEFLNEHKMQQLRELAALNGTVRDEEFCRLCGEQGHKHYACPSRTSIFKSDVHCKICGDGGHPTIDCPTKGSGSANKMDDEYQSFLAELGGSAPESLTKHSITMSIQGSNSGSNPPWVSGSKEYDETNLYIGYLPPSFDDDGLIRLFAPFGDIVMAKVIKDKLTGLSKGYGFVKYADASMANQAIASMHGYHLEGRTIAARVAGKPPQPAVPPGPPAPTPATSYPSPFYPLQQPFMAGPMEKAPPPPPGSYAGQPLPFPYAPYPPPPPPTSAMFSPVGGQVVSPYGLHCPPPSQITGSTDATNNTPGLMYGAPHNASGSIMVSPIPPPYSTPSYGYAAYFTPIPSLPPPTFDPTNGPASVTDFSLEVNPPQPKQHDTSNGGYSEYEKFLSEIQ